MIVVVPTDPPDLGSVLFEETTTYHWPQFNLNVTDAFGATPLEGFSEVDGPNMFKKGIGLSKEDQQVDYVSNSPRAYKYNFVSVILVPYRQ